MAPESSAGSVRLNVTVYPSGWTVAWLTTAKPTPNGPRTRRTARWSTEVAGPGALDTPEALLAVVLEAYRP